MRPGFEVNPGKTEQMKKEYTKMKNAVLKAAVLAAVLAITPTACEGPAGPAGSGITINGTPVADDISAALENALEGHTGAGPHTVTVTGVDLSNTSHYAALLHGIAGGLSGTIELDLSGCTGLFVDKALIPPAEKARFTKLTLPSTVVLTADRTEEERDAVFGGWTGLTDVTAPNLVDIGNATFYGCSALTSVSLPLAENTGYSIFYGCTALGSVSLPLAESIGSYTFASCTALSSVSLPLAESIGGSAFAYCTALTLVSLGATPPALPSGGYSGLFYHSTAPANTVTITVPNGKLADYNTTWSLGGTYTYAQGSNAAKWGTNHPAIKIEEAP
jgi:hypothetical protein